MNKFQAMAQIMAILCEDGRLQKGSQKYEIARKLIEVKIDKMGPDAAYSKAKWNRHELFVQINELQRLSRLERIVALHFISWCRPGSC
jgi:hypothetical protein